MLVLAEVRSIVIVSLAGLATLCASACELTMYQAEKIQRDCSRAWQPSCPLAVDISLDRPIQSTASDVDRGKILEQAEAAPHRTCDIFPIGCQASEIGDVIVDRYVLAF